jgi:predicted O-methyltransferase YrrM
VSANESTPTCLPNARAAVFAKTKGFMPSNEADALHAAALASPSGVWLEIGTYCGKSTVVLGDAAQRTGTHLVTLDHHRGSEENQPGWEWHDATLVDPFVDKLDTLPSLRRTLHAAGLESTVDVLVSSTQAVSHWWNSQLSLLFLDGNHTEAVAQHDYAAFAPHLAPTGSLIVHDVFPDPADGGQAPWHVVERALAEGFTEVSMTGSLRVLRRQP